MNNENEQTPQPDTAPLPPMALPGTPDSPAEPLPAIMDAAGDFTPNWYERFADLQPHAATLAKFKRPEALAKSYANLERMKGYPDVADARRMAAFRAMVGLPATAEEYSLPRPDDTPDEAWDDQLAAALAQVAYEYGIPSRAMEALTQRYAGESRHMLQACHAAEQQAVQQADAELQAEWGRSYENNMRTIGDFMVHLGHECGVDVQGLVENPALRANADFARLMLAAASKLQEAPLRSGSPANSKDEAHRIAHDPSHPLHEAYMRTNHPQHRYANEQYDRLAFGQ